jgi:hypothetical protein
MPRTCAEFADATFGFLRENVPRNWAVFCDPEDDDNLAWVSHEEHARLVRWWNERYRGLTRTA